MRRARRDRAVARRPGHACAPPVSLPPPKTAGKFSQSPQLPSPLPRAIRFWLERKGGRVAAVITIGEILVEIMATQVGQTFLEPGLFQGPYPSGAPAIF